MLLGLDHIIIAVRDLESASSGMERMLGRAPSWSGEHPGEGTGNRLFRLGNMYVELMAARSGGGQAGLLESHLASKGEGVWGLSFATNDAEACRKFFEKNDIAPVMIKDGSGKNDMDGAERRWRLVLPSLEAMRGLFLFAIEHQSDRDLLPVAAGGEEASSVSDLDHLVITTSDPDAMKNLLGARGMGLRLALDQIVPKWGGRQMFFRSSGAVIEVVEGKKEGVWGLAWRVSDVAAAHQRMESHGFNVSPVRGGRKKGTIVFTLRDAPAQIPTLIIGADVG